MNTPEISKASVDTLEKLIDDIRANIETLRVLRALTVLVDSSDVFILAIISSKLDYNTRRKLP